MRRLSLLISVFIIICLFTSCDLFDISGISGSNKDSSLPPAADHEHFFSEWKPVILPSVEEKGLEKRHCFFCGGVETAVIDKLVPAENLEFSFNYGYKTYSVSGIGTCEDAYILIPSTYEGYPVDKVERRAFGGNKTLKYVVLPDTIEDIGTGAFSYCNNLVGIELPNSLISIGQSAFQGSANLEKIVIPDSVRILGQNALYKCTGLKELVIGRGLSEIPGDYDNPREGVFGLCTSLASVIIPDTITSIGDYAFSGCQNLESITLPDSVKKIGSGAFMGCKKLKHVHLGGGLEHIGGLYGVSDNVYAGAFEKCKSIESITFPDTLKTIGKESFSGCSNLTSVTLPKSVTEIGVGAFEYCTSLAEVNMTNTITAIGIAAFRNCCSLKEITIPSSVKTIGLNAFQGCDALENVYYQGSIDGWCTIDFDDDYSNPLMNGCNLYFGDKLVENVAFPSKFANIPDRVFAGCTSLKSVSIPKSVKSIGVCAFYNCQFLESVSLPESVNFVGGGAFQKCISLKHFEFYNPNIVFSNAVFDDYPTFSFNEYDNGLYLGNKENPYLMFYKVKDNTLDSCKIHEKTGVIYSYAFSYCKNLKSLEIPEGVTVIGAYTFVGSKALETISIPSSLEIIDNNDFRFCESLQYTEYDGVLYLGNEENPYVLLVDVTDLARSEYTIHKDTKIIYDDAFSLCENLLSITIPQSVVYIGNNAFAHCNSLQTIYIPDSVKTIEGYLVFSSEARTTVYCEAKSKPEGWAEWWVTHPHIVCWGYVIEE